VCTSLCSFAARDSGPAHEPVRGVENGFGSWIQKTVSAIEFEYGTRPINVWKSWRMGRGSERSFAESALVRLMTGMHGWG
jgi:hypothetical protein